MLLFRLREKLKHEHVEDCLNQLLNNEKMTPGNLQQWQMRYLKEELEYLKVHHPFYSKFMDENGIDLSADYKTPSDLLDLFPIIDKNFIREHFKEWLSDEKSYDNISWRSTSGSTGIPFKFHMTPEGDWYKTASKYRLYHRFGINIDDKQLCYGSGERKNKITLSNIKSDLNNRFVNYRYFSDSSVMTDEFLANQIDIINRLKITSIWGYPSTIFEIAQYSLTHNKPIHNKNLKAVIYSGEGHTDYMSEVIKSAMGNIIIIDEYNSIEGFIAGTCLDGKLHLNEDTALFEVLLPDGTISKYGKGELLITQLFFKEFPIIRYKNGDVVEIVEEECKCGLPFRPLKQVDGRSVAFIYNGDTIIPHTICSHHIHHTPYKGMVSRVQMEQYEKNSVTIRIILVDKSSDVTGLEQAYRDLFDKIKVKFEYVDDIPREKSGKFRDVIQNIK